MVLLGVVLTVGCAWILTLPDLSLKGRIAGWVGTPFFGLATLAAALLVFKPSRVTLNASGFVITPPLAKPRRVAWRDIEPLFIWQVRRTRGVAYRFLPDRRPPGLLAGFNAALGYDGSLPAALPIKAQALADLMNAYRAAAAAAAEAQAPQ
jgi:hypothetical protein